MKRKTSGKATKRADHIKVATGYKVSDLTKALGITAKTIYHLEAKYKGPLSTDTAEGQNIWNEGHWKREQANQLNWAPRTTKSYGLNYSGHRLARRKQTENSRNSSWNANHKTLSPWRRLRKQSAEYWNHFGRCSMGCQRHSPFRLIPLIRKWLSKQLKRH